VSSLIQDVRHAARSLAKTPTFTAAVVLTLALGIGANTAIFQLINAVGLRSLPVKNPEELAEVRIGGGNEGFGVNPGRYSQLTQPVWREVQAHQQAFSGIFAWGTLDVRVGERVDLRPANAIAVSGDFFRVLGVEPWRGRLIAPADEASCPASVAVVSYGYWQRAMGGHELSADLRLKVNLQPVDIIGVTPPGFFGVAVGESFDIAMPLCRPKELRRELFDIAVLGRLRPGWTIERASAHLNALSAGIFEDTAPTGYSASSIARFKAFRMAAYPASTGVSSLRAQYNTSLRLLLAITGLVLLITCANLANLMLARASARGHEVAVRVALGASRATLLRQFLTESVLIAGIGAVLALGLAQILGRIMIRALATQGGSPTLSLAADWRVLSFTGLIAFGTCTIFGLVPAVRATRAQGAMGLQALHVMRGGGRGSTAGHERLSAQRLMVGMQIAISLVMLVAAMLFVRSFRNLITFDPGMREDGIAVAYLGFQEAGVPPEQFSDFRRGLLSEVGSIPGIVSAGTTSQVPLVGGSWSHGLQVGAKQGGARFTWVSPGYLETMGIRVLQGRDFTLRDTHSSPRVAIVNQTFIRRLVDGNPIGQTLRTGPEPGYPSTAYEIVGVIPDTQYNNLRGETPPMVFAPDSQHPSQGPWAAMMIHSSVPPDVAIASVRQRLRQTYPQVISEFSVFRSQIRDRLVRERLLAMLAGFFGALAAILTVVGLYGMLSFAVLQRRQEISIRIALGAQRGHIVGLVMREAGWLLVVGVAVGTLLSLLAGRSAASFLFGLKPNDPSTLAAASLLLAFIAAAASFLPANRAARTDPAQVLKEA
jgi:putative ABC transport system permease protein